MLLLLLLLLRSQGSHSVRVGEKQQHESEQLRTGSFL